MAFTDDPPDARPTLSEERGSRGTGTRASAWMASPKACTALGAPWSPHAWPPWARKRASMRRDPTAASTT